MVFMIDYNYPQKYFHVIKNVYMYISHSNNNFH